MLSFNSSNRYKPIDANYHSLRLCVVELLKYIGFFNISTFNTSTAQKKYTDARGEHRYILSNKLPTSESFVTHSIR